MYVLYNIQGNVLLTKLMRKLYQILYTVGRLTYAPARRAFFFLGDTLAVGFSLSRGHLSSGRFPFRGTLEQWAGLRGGKALGVTKPAFPPRAPPFRARRCSALWYVTMYWKRFCILRCWLCGDCADGCVVNTRQTPPICHIPGNRPAERAAFPSGGTKKSAQPDTTDTAAYRTKPIN